MSPANPGKATLVAVLLLTALTAQNTIATSVKAFVNRDKISIVDSFSLTIRSSEGSAFDNPDFTVLEEDFEILSTRRSSQHSIVNGRAESSLDWHLDLAPKRAGDLVIPPIEVNGEFTEPLVVSVSDAPPPDQRAGNDPVFLESEVDQQQVYVQAQLILTVRIYYAVAIARGAELEDLEIPDALVSKLNEASYETTIKNLRYNVHEVKYAIFPQRSGELRVPPQTFSARLSGQRGFSVFGATRGKTVRARSQEHTVKVKPKAAAYTGRHWLPASNLSLVESWSKDPQQLHVGEPITRTLTVTTQGLQAAQIPPLDMQNIANAQQYPDQPKNSDEPSINGITGTRIESVAVIASTGDSLQMPEVRLPWWNTETNRQEEAVIPAKRLPLLGGMPAQTAPAQPPATDAIDPANSVARLQETTGKPAAATPPFWIYGAITLACAWALTLLYVYYLHRRIRRYSSDRNKTVVSGEAKAFARVEAACDKHHAAALRAALIDWARAAFHSETISALSDIARRSTDVGTQALLVELDRTLYHPDANGSGFDFSALKTAMQQWRKQRTKQRRTKPSEPGLAPLYRTLPSSP